MGPGLSATLLSDGRVLVVGGCQLPAGSKLVGHGSGALASAELYQP